MMFSATLSKEIRPVCKKFMQDPMEVYIDDEAKLTLHGLQQHYVKLKDSEKNRKLFELLDVLEFNQVVIFVKSVQRCVALAQLLIEQNFPAIAIHRGMSQEERLSRYQQFKDFQKRILVATNLFGRGMDIERVNIVFNYDMPEDTDTYLHRVARAGRFGTKGLAITFVSDESDAKTLNEVQERFEVDITELPDDIDLEMRGNRDTLEASKLHDSSPLNVRGEIDLVRQLRDVHLKPLLHLIQGLSVRLVADEGDGQTLGTKPASPSNSVQVSVSVLWHVVVEDDVDALDVHSTPKQVGGDQNPLLEVLELLVPGQPLLLAHAPVDSDGGEVLLDQQLRQRHASLHGLDEDHHLVKLQHVKQLKELPVLLRVLQFDVVLPQPVQSELRLVVDVHLHRLQTGDDKLTQQVTHIMKRLSIDIHDQLSALPPVSRPNLS